MKPRDRVTIDNDMRRACNMREVYPRDVTHKPVDPQPFQELRLGIFARLLLAWRRMTAKGEPDGV